MFFLQKFHRNFLSILLYKETKKTGKTYGVNPQQFHRSPGSVHDRRKSPRLVNGPRRSFTSNNEIIELMDSDDDSVREESVRVFHLLFDRVDALICCNCLRSSFHAFIQSLGAEKHARFRIVSATSYGRESQSGCQPCCYRFKGASNEL